MRSSYFLALSLFLVVGAICLLSCVSPSACRVPQASPAPMARSVLWGNAGQKLAAGAGRIRPILRR